jgi:hypothetical protein
MDLHVDIEWQEGLLLATASGNVRFDTALRLFKRIFDMAAENQVSKVLVNALAVEGELAGFERYSLGAEVAEFLEQRQFRVRLALVGKPPTVNGFAIRIAQNRGIIAEVFASQQEALAWLEASPG